ncbi:MAG: Ig-like domain repeat protein [Bryobacteraceae bacterium]
MRHTTRLLSTLIPILCAVGFTPAAAQTAIGGGFKQPQGVAVDRSGNVFVADTGNGQVKVVPPGCVSSGCVLPLGGSFTSPDAVAVDASGNLYVADSGTGKVRALLASSGYTTFGPLNATFALPTGVAWDGRDNLFVADFGTSKVFETGLAPGSLANAVGSALLAASGVAVDGSGNLFVADEDLGLIEFHPDDYYSQSYQLASGSEYIVQPYGIAVDVAGNLYYTDLTLGGVFKLTAASGYTTVSTVATGLDEPMGVAVDLLGDVFVADPNSGNGVVREYPATPPSATLTSSLNPSPLDAPVTFTATVSSPLGTPTGTLTFKDGATTLGTAGLVSGAATFTTASLGLGGNSITAVWNGDGVFSGMTCTSAPLTQTVALDATSTTLISSSNPSAVGQAVTFTAVVSGAGGTPTGTVTFKDGTTTLGAPSLVSGTATFTTSSLTFGSHSITANYGGDSNFASSASAALIQAVGVSASQTTLISSANPSAVGQAVTFTAVVSGAGGTPTGTVTFKDGTTTLGTPSLVSGTATFTTSSLTLGSHSITANYGGDSTFASSTSAALTQAVGVTTTTTTVSSSANPSAAGQTVTFTASVTSSGGTPTGTVTFLDGTTTLATVNLGSGVATYTTSALSVGNHSITASYSGSGTYAASTSTILTQSVGVTATTTTLSSSANPSAIGQAVIFTAVVSGSGGTPTGTVTFLDGSTPLATVALFSGVATATSSSLALGGHAITARYSGSASFAASTSAILTQSVGQTATTTTLSSSANPSAAGQSVTFTASVTSSSGTPSGAVTFSDGSTTLATVGLFYGVATYTTSALAQGSHSTTASYGGSGSFAASLSAPITQTVGPAATITALFSSANPSAAGQSVMFTAVVIAPVGMPAGTVTFFDGAATLSTTSLVSGVASFTTSALSLGSHSITAAYSGNLTASASAPLIQTVGQASSTAPQLSVLPAVLTFLAVQNGANPAPATIAVANTGVGRLQWTASTDSTSPWLSIAELAGSTPAAVSVTVNATGLAIGTYAGTILVTSGGQQRTVALALIVKPPAPARLSAAPAAFVVNAMAPSSTPLARSIAATNVGSGALAWTATSNAAWLTVSPASGSAPSMPTIQLNPAGLSAAQYLGTVTFSSPGVPDVTVAVVFNLSALPDLISTAPLLEFHGTSGAIMPVSLVPPVLPLATTTGAEVSFSANAVLAAGQSWLALSGTDGLVVSTVDDVTPSSIFAGVSIGALPAGVYVGYIAAQSAAARNTLLTPVVLNLGKPSAPGTLSVSPGGLLVPGPANPTAGGTLMRGVALVSNGAPFSWTAEAIADAGGTWLTVSPATGSGNVAVTANLAGLQPGVYTGQVGIAASGTSNPDAIIPVTLVLTSGTTAVATGSILQPVQPAGDFLVNLGVPVLLEASMLSSTGQPVAGDTVEVSFTTGEPPVTLSGTSNGTYAGVWTPTQPGPVSLLFLSSSAPAAIVTGTVIDPGNGQPAMSAIGAVSGASFVSGMPLAPGSIASIFGVNLAAQTALAPGLPQLTPLGGATLTINGVAAPLFAATPGQLNLFVPWELEPQTTATMVLSTAGGVAALADVPVAPQSPGVFQIDAAGDAAAVHLNGALVSVTAPADTGELLEIFATGLCPVAAPPADGTAAPSSPPLVCQTTPQVTIGDVPAQVLFAGLAPGFAGLYQLNVVVPEGLPSGPATLAIDAVPLHSNNTILQIR